MAEKQGDGSVIGAFLMGSLIGIGVGLIIAPITGKETRERIKKAAEIAKEKMSDLSTEVKTHAEEVMEQTKKILEEVKTQIKHVGNSIREATAQKKEELEQKINPA